VSVVITGSAGLVGSEAARFFCARGYDVIGIDCDLRRSFFGDDASTEWNRRQLEVECRDYRHHDADIRDRDAVERILKASDVELMIHTAAQPSHDWAARDPHTDFSVNAAGTLNLLEGLRRFHPDAVFIFTSTNKVYGDHPNRLPLVEHETRWELPERHASYRGIDESMPVDHCLHSLFGVSKLAADLLVQEYGRYFGMKTVCFRCGCITGPEHAAAELHGFLAYLARCVMTGREYRVYGYKGKQVRDNIHARDVVSAFFHAFQEPRAGEVYNLGGGRSSNVSLLEALAKIEAISGVKALESYVPEPRAGDHVWYISDLAKFRSHYPGWRLTYDVDAILEEIVGAVAARV
jgi:CDP-paratose 2-epimerase